MNSPLVRKELAMTTTKLANNGSGIHLTLTNQHIYTPRKFYRYVGLAVGIAGGVLGFFMSSIGQGFPSTGSLITIVEVSICIGVGVTLLQYFALKNVRLITSDEGIVLYGQAGYRLYTPWDNLMGRALWSTGRGGVRVIRLRTPAKEMSLTDGIQQRQAAIEKRGWLIKVDMTHMSENCIPVNFFLSNWQRSPLAQDIKQHAPDVDWNKREAGALF